MAAEGFVRTLYPEAVAIHRDQIRTLGEAAPILKEEWIVLSSAVLGSKLLGRGPTEDAAWDAAARSVRVEEPKPRLSFSEWLAEQAKHEGMPRNGGSVRKSGVTQWRICWAR